MYLQKRIIRKQQVYHRGRNNVRSVVVVFGVFVVRMPLALDVRVEPGVLVSGVVHDADGAVGLVQRVVALHHVAVAGLVLLLDVLRVLVLHLVRELVLGVRLKRHAAS